MNSAINIKQLPIEVFTEDEVLTGHMSCPSSIRLLDFLNQTGVEKLNSRNDFCIFDDFQSYSNISQYQEVNRLFIRKASIHFVAVDEVNLGRGAGAEKGRNGYPVVPKSSVLMTLRLQNHKLTGNLYYGRGQTIKDSIDSDTAFLPLTHVTIIRDQHVYGIRPFVAVNKEHIIWSQEEYL
jgi:hypothetical protein